MASTSTVSVNDTTDTTTVSIEELKMNREAYEKLNAIQQENEARVKAEEAKRKSKVIETYRRALFPVPSYYRGPKAAYLPFESSRFRGDNRELCIELMNDIVDDHGNTALHIACEYEDIDAVKFFIEIGADINKPNNIGLTPLGMVEMGTSGITNDRCGLIMSLIDAGADIYVNDKSMRSLNHISLNNIDNSHYIKRLIQVYYDYRKRLDLKQYDTVTIDGVPSCP